MFDDEEQSENYDDGSREIDGYKIYRDQVEKEFFASLERGENISTFLYLPHFFISKNVKEQLDIFLLEEAYKNMFREKDLVETIYSDPYLSVVISDEKFKKEMLEQMLEHFTSSEEYEKCIKIKSELDKCTLKNKTNAQEKII